MLRHYLTTSLRTLLRHRVYSAINILGLALAACMLILLFVRRELSYDADRLLVWQFSKPVLLANLVAWPVAWWAMRHWLNGFDARIALGPGPFVAAALLALVIAAATIGGHAIRVARRNPIHALRYE